MKNEFNNLKITRAYRQSTEKSYNIKKRETRALVIRVGKKVEYVSDEVRFTTTGGDVIFIHFGATYSARPLDGKNEFMIVRFISDEVGEWEVLHIDDAALAAETHAELCRALVFDDRKSRMRAMSLFYKLLSIISEEERRDHYLPSRKLEMIRPALDYIESNIFSTGFKVGELHKLAGLSDVYFRELFISHTGMTPQAYVTAKRMEYASELITAGGAKIKDVARAVGYTDPLYFSRIYKQHFLHAPSISMSKKTEIV